MTTLKDHLLNIPPVTRFFTIATLTMMLLSKLGFINLGKFLYEPSIAISDIYYIKNADGWQLKFWRSTECLDTLYKFFTTFSYVVGDGPFVFLNIYSFYVFSSKLESRQGKFKGNFPDYIWLILTTGTMLIVFETLLVAVCEHFDSDFPLGWVTFTYHRKLLACLTFVWLRYLKSSTVDFLGIFRIRSYYLPLFELGLAIVNTRTAVWDSLIGCFVGYLYLCIQSNTLPIYNLVARVYGKADPRLTSTRRLGLSSTTHDEFLPSIYDLGYLKAPKWLYTLLSYPYLSSVRTTAFTRMPQPSIKLSEGLGFRSSFLNQPEVTFKGSGHRLGGSSDKKND